MLPSAIVSRLRRSLLVKVTSRQSPSRADIASLIELTASKLVEAVQAQAMSFSLDEGSHISIRQVYYSPTLWDGDPAKGAQFSEAGADLCAWRIPRGDGIVGRVIASGESVFYRNPDRNGAVYRAAHGAPAGG